MNDFDIKPTVDPKNKYEKARKDALQALDSISKLDMKQQQELFKELLSIWQINLLVNNCRN